MGEDAKQRFHLCSLSNAGDPVSRGIKWIHISELNGTHRDFDLFFFILGKKQQITYKEILTFYFFIFSGDVKLPLEQKQKIEKESE